MRFYEGTLKLLAKYLDDEVNIFTPLEVTTKHIKDYLEFTKTKERPMLNKMIVELREGDTVY